MDDLDVAADVATKRRCARAQPAWRVLRADQPDTRRARCRRRQLAAHAETERKIDAETALTDGIAHRIEDIDIPQGAPVLTVRTG